MSASVMVHEILGVSVVHHGSTESREPFGVVTVFYAGGTIKLMVPTGQRLEVATFLQDAATDLRLNPEYTEAVPCDG